MALEERRRRARPAEPLQGDHIEALAFEPSHHLTCPLLAGTGRALSLGNERLRPQDRLPGPEERVAVGDAVVRTAGDPKHGFPSPDLRERKPQAVDLDPVAALDELPRLVGVALRVGPAGQPPAVVAPLRGPERRVGEDVPFAHLLPAPERLEDRASGKLILAVAEQRPVRDFARGRPPRADRVQEPARPLSCKPVEVRGVGGLVPGPASEHVVCPVGEAVEEENDDGIHAARRLPRAACPVPYFRR